jgi:hypothetical protein
LRRAWISRRAALTGPERANFARYGADQDEAA